MDRTSGNDNENEFGIEILSFEESANYIKLILKS